MQILKDGDYLIKLKTAGLSDAQIAKRLNMPVDQVAVVWAKILAELNAKLTCGYVQLCDTFKTLALQYQQLGESLKVVSMALSEPMSAEEVRSILTDGTDLGEQLGKKFLDDAIGILLKNAIILRPFALKDPETN